MQVSKEMIYTIKMDGAELGRLRWVLTNLKDAPKQVAEEAESWLFKLPKP